MMTTPAEHAVIALQLASVLFTWGGPASAAIQHQQQAWVPKPRLADADVPPLTVEVQVGGTAFLPCPAASSGHDSPVWIRRKDYHILTGGKANYITDQRFQVLFNHANQDWTLQIKFVRLSDNGTYECQVSSGSSFTSGYVHLHVYQPVATITSGTEYHVQQGTTIQLVCVVEGSPSPPSFVFWYHGNNMINYDKRRGGIRVETESQEKTFSRLTVTDANRHDSGNYSCRPSNAQPVSVHVYVSQGDKMAAIQRKSGAAAGSRGRHTGPLHTAAIALLLLALPAR